MTKKEIEQLFQKVRKGHEVFATIAKEDKIYIERVFESDEVDYSGKIPFDPWKFLFFPPQEALLNEKLKEPKASYPKICAWGMNILDLKALGLLDLVFEGDPYYQKRRANVLVVGLSVGAPSQENFEDFKIFSLKLEEDVLEHVPFDIFLEKMVDNNFLVYSGSKTGQKILESCGIKDYENVQFAGLIPEEGLDKRMLELQEKMIKGFNNQIWDKLNNICLACGKCTIICPTCFCFDMKDEVINKKELNRQRNWGNCFYPEFSEIAGGFDFTNTVKKKIQFWYEHKFLRVPHEYKVPGCISCLRCFKVCPVGINIIEVLNNLEESSSSSQTRLARKNKNEKPLSTPGS